MLYSIAGTTTKSKFVKVRLDPVNECRKVPLRTGFVAFAETVAERFGVDVRYCGVLRYVDDDDELVVSSEAEYLEMLEERQHKSPRINFSLKNRVYSPSKMFASEETENTMSTKITALHGLASFDQPLDHSCISPQRSSHASTPLEPKCPGASTALYSASK